jgi:hypothetical protein
MRNAMDGVAIDDSCIGKRAEARTSLAVMATMACATHTGPVMIRNLSTRGAMIVCVRPPEVGQKVELRRGEVRAVASVVWNDIDKAGLNFAQPVTVADWMSNGHAGQQAVDDLFQQLKAGSRMSGPEGPESGTRVAPGELEQTADGLEQLADILSADAEVIERYMAELQILDIAAQTMRKLAEIA